VHFKAIEVYLLMFHTSTSGTISQFYARRCDAVSVSCRKCNSSIIVTMACRIYCENILMLLICGQ